MVEAFTTLGAAMVPCSIDQEHYDILPLGVGTILCTGHLIVSSQKSTRLVARVHQRLSVCLRYDVGEMRICHLHASNPYTEMAPDDEGFPYRMGRKSYECLQDLVREQTAELENRTEALRAMNEELRLIGLMDPLTGLFNRHEFNRVLREGAAASAQHLGIAYFDINGLKPTNDSRGHRAGDDLVRHTAKCIKRSFPGKAYRIGGDEFVVLDPEMDKEAFEALIEEVSACLHDSGVSVALGSIWTAAPYDAEALFDEADHLMYRDKKRYYDSKARE